ncbi:MAG: gamma-glutamyltransferase [Cyanobacteria bacterium P01_A01_bin.123]
MTETCQGTIAAGHPKVAEAGASILAAGGNAFDSAIAAVFASFVAEPTLTSVAGGGFLLAHTAQGEDVLFDFFTQTPCSKVGANPIDFYPVNANFGDTVQEFHIGLGSMATPGNFAGLLHVHQRLGRLPLKILVEPAIALAETGVIVDDFRAYSFILLEPILMANAATRDIYAPGGDLLKVGDRFCLPAMAEALANLAQSGIDGFYRGDFAHHIVQACAAQGGYLTQADFDQYQVIERSPLRLNYRGNTLLTNPPPSSGGTLIAFALSLLSQTDLSQFTPGSVDHLRTLVEAMRLTNVARRDGFDANLYQENVADFFLSSDHAAPYWHDFKQQVNKWGSTTHVSVIDSDGNAASVTTSNGEGSSYVIPGTQIMVNNMLGEEDLNPHGFHQWQTNQRISSMMAPTLVLKDGQAQIALGSGGANRIRTAILQVISNVVDFHLPIAEAVVAPRIHWERETFNLEPGFDREAIGEIGDWPVNDWLWWSQPNMFFGGVHAVTVNDDGTITGAGDFRRGGHHLSIPQT